MVLAREALKDAQDAVNRWIDHEVERGEPLEG